MLRVGHGKSKYRIMQCSFKKKRKNIIILKKAPHRLHCLSNHSSLAPFRSCWTISKQPSSNFLRKKLLVLIIYTRKCYISFRTSLLPFSNFAENGPTHQSTDELPKLSLSIKKGDSTDPGNYWPVSLTFVFRKSWNVVSIRSWQTIALPWI